ncbi:class I SAM-dependent methyltransferase [Streptomyces sp. NPDC015139]|uniref:class I SAM-dependent methyltransferase n=1 Tax=Streptomyces sp. NPDC015139 TaxID=3364942 RepID=UPI0036F9DDB9
MPAREGGRALDACCGTGELVAFLTFLGYEVDGVDFAEGALTRARTERAGLPGVRWLCADIEHDNLADLREGGYDRGRPTTWGGPCEGRQLSRRHTATQGRAAGWGGAGSGGRDAGGGAGRSGGAGGGQARVISSRGSAARPVTSVRQRAREGAGGVAGRPDPHPTARVRARGRWSGAGLEAAGVGEARGCRGVPCRPEPHSYDRTVMAGQMRSRRVMRSIGM